MLRLTEDRVPAREGEARAINKAAKDLAEHRNKIAHGVPMIAFAGGDDASFIAGIRKSKRDRKYPAVQKASDLITVEAVKGMVITVDEVRERIAEAEKVKKQMHRFAMRLNHLRYFTPAPPTD
jgi:hypothetical protein